MPRQQGSVSWREITAAVLGIGWQPGAEGLLGTPSASLARSQRRVRLLLPQHS